MMARTMSTRAQPERFGAGRGLRAAGAVRGRSPKRTERTVERDEGAAERAARGVAAVRDARDALAEAGRTEPAERETGL